MASRNRKALSLDEKLDSLNAIDKQPARKRVDIAKGLRLPLSTLNSIVSKWAEIEGNATLFGDKAKQAHGAKYGNLDEALLTWFKQARAAGVNFDSSILREKAMKIADRLGIIDFVASNCWIDCFQKRHDIAYRAVSGEAVSVNLDTVDDCKATFSSIIEGEVETAMVQAEDPEESAAATSDQELSVATDTLGAIGVSDDYVAVDATIVMLECQSNVEIVANLVASDDAHACNDDDEHKPQDSGDLTDPRFAESLLRRYVAPQRDADSNVAFQAIEKCMVLSSEQKKWQASILDFF
ncbi:hypothetical protein HPB49_008816 [Dermacentor silvarum]|uniref:Uncharacterized protein n=1 Tax=Dermacentor silvarum TaxID=543639 RepID=A0ACB8DYA6_DERSI|nr:hypothetical protein HPB49_008816 [Dermacentor silvarum]